ncbi:hypothetical protein C7U89_04130 [Bradyrhizobium sp. WBOS4]|nr:hypothetical protein [Bradyrhizobium sp. WBOS8]MDD1582139.1 hypothetical protein [Bradyrhizobium sp. WBOS4]UUO47286.1 hypothetical protein DCM78_10340 [Bradyrhizobium sp. WBOS04]UUO60904.1 hypothetical protein DCM80_18080 [Bradyrhizobium sp. WBOS08]
MAGLVPAVHALLRPPKNVDARDKPGHDDFSWISTYDSPAASGAARGVGFYATFGSSSPLA